MIFRRAMALGRRTKIQKLRIYFADQPRSVALELLLGFLLLVKDAIVSAPIAGSRCCAHSITQNVDLLHAQSMQCRWGRLCIFCRSIEKMPPRFQLISFVKTRIEIPTSATILRKAQSGICRRGRLCMQCRLIEKMPP